MSVLGRNGAGKTTLLKTIMGIVRAEQGNVWLGAKEISGLAPNDIAMAGVGYVPQGRAIFPSLTVIENLRVTQFAQGKSDERVEELIEFASRVEAPSFVAGRGIERRSTANPCAGARAGRKSDGAAVGRTVRRHPAIYPGYDHRGPRRPCEEGVAFGPPCGTKS